jgi:hypothetical protein
MERKKPIGVTIIGYLHMALSLIMLYSLVDMIRTAVPAWGVNEEFEARLPLWWIIVFVICASISVTILSGIGLLKLKKWGRLTSMIFFPAFLSYAIRIMLSPNSAVFFPLKYVPLVVVLYCVHICYFIQPKVKEQFK